jgi:DNA primase
MSVVDEVKSRLDIVTFVQRYVPITKSGRVYKACCPFHSEKTPSFVVNPDRQTWRCFGSCATGGDLFGFAMRYHGWTFKEALEELAKLAGVPLRPESPERKAQDAQAERLRGLVAAAAEFYHAHLFDAEDHDAVAALAYAREKRRLSDDTLRSFQVGYAPNGWQHLSDHLLKIGYTRDDLYATGVSGRGKNDRPYDLFRHRLMIPIRDERGRPVGFGGRALDPKEKAKYINSPQTTLFDKSRLLFALDAATRAMRDTDTAVIVEGYLDAIQAHQAGYTNVVAQMGTALTETQIRLIAPRRAHCIVLALDADAAGQNATRRSVSVAQEALEKDYAGRLSVDLRVLTIPDAKDPDDLIREHPEMFRHLVETAQPIADYLIETLVAQLPPKASLQQREALARELLPLLMATESNLYRQDNVQKLALRLRIPERDLIALAAGMRRTQQRTQERIAAAKPPRQPAQINGAPAAASAREDVVEPPSSIDDLPTEPPPELDDYLPGDLGLASENLSALPGMPVKQERRPEMRVERDCLRRLFRQPELYYDINRKFRELAHGAPDGLGSYLNELCADDFRFDTYHALMLTFEEAMSQDRVYPLDYMRQQFDVTLNTELDRLLMMDEWDELRTTLRYVNADLPRILKQNIRFSVTVSPVEIIVREALYLREQRLKRQWDSLIFLQLDAQTQDADNDYPELIDQFRLLGTVRRRVQVELSRTKTV